MSTKVTQALFTVSRVCVLCGQAYDTRANAGYALCVHCYSVDKLREYDRLEAARTKAVRAGQEATLTLIDWLNTIAAFRGLCAYCETSFYSAIDLYRPDAGLTASNAVPICRSCAIHKRASFDAAVERVGSLLLMSTSNNEPV